MTLRAAALLLMLIGQVSEADAQRVVQKLWYESRIDSNRVTLAWETTEPTGTQLMLLRDTNVLADIHFRNYTREHSVELTQLESATTYLARFISSDTVERFVSTASGNVGRIQVFFNRSVDRTFVPPLAPANENVEYFDLMKGLIDSARESIDLALYSFSGSVGNAIGTRLIAAKNRGVRVRVIADSASSQSSPPFTRLAANGIPTIVNSFGLNGDVKSNIHHNKFIIIDGRAASPRATTLTGSWNLSDNQTYNDFQNLVLVEDLSLARAYLREFNEMWGSVGDIPNADSSGFSVHKRDNTPRSFVVANAALHLHFSPNGDATRALDSGLGLAKHQILFATLSFTRDELARTLLAKWAQDIEVHGIINNNDQGGEFTTLKSAGVDVHYYPANDTLLLHHKYALVDPGTDSAWVITGSQNWSTSGEERNNENMLFIQDRKLSEAYFQEWLARYKEAGGVEPVMLPTNSVVHGIPVRARKGGLFSITWEQADAGFARITVLDLLGHIVSRAERYFRAGEAELLLSRLNRGVYACVVEHDGVRESRKFVIY